jgi:hypothetical protein
MDLDDLDCGNVPAWLGAGSLILACLVFMRDRTSSERAQVDLVGAWATVEYERSAPDVSPSPGPISRTTSWCLRQETKELRFGVNVAHMAPEGAVQLHLLDGIRARVEWLLVVDNAGRQRRRPESGRRAKRIDRWWRPKQLLRMR